MSINTKEFNDRVERWQSSEPGELAQNFHALQSLPTDEGGPVNLQFVKATSFPIAGIEQLSDVADTVQEIRIWMTLKEFDKNTVGYEPILQVFYLDTKGVSQNFLLGTADNNNGLTDSEPVPLPFVQNTTQLWKELESENLPGMFDIRNSTGRIERVQFYKVHGTGLDIMKRLFPTMTALNILPGLDLNKSANHDDSIFIPIVNIQVPTVTIIEINEFTNNHLTGVHIHLQDGDDDTYFDYSSPCPPICDPGMIL